MTATLTNETIHRLRAVLALAMTQLGEDGLYPQMLRQIGELMRVETIVLLLREGSEHELQASVSSDEKFERNLWSALKSADGRRTIDRVAQSERPLVIRGWLRQVKGRTPGQGFILVGAPLLIGQRKLGVILVATRRPRHFSEDELLLLQLIAERLTLAIGLRLSYQSEQWARVQAETNQRLRDEFLAMLSHELRTPLNSILGWVCLLRSGKLNAEQTQQALATIERNARLQSQLINDLIDLSAVCTVSAESDGAQPDASPTVYLPLRVKPEEETQQLLPHLPTEVENTRQDLSGLHILVVADDDDSRQLVSTVLSHCQAEARMAENANQALAILEAWQPDVLISDLAMPGMNGFELIRQVRARELRSHHKTLAIALTRHTQAEDRVRVLTSGFQTHLPKPVAPAELLAVVASLTGRIGRRKNHNGAS